MPITTVAKLENDTVRDWMEIFRRSPLFREDSVGQIGAAVGSTGKRFRLPHYNVLKDTIVVSDGTIVDSYRPVENDQIISDAILRTAPSAGATFSYTSLKATLRGRGQAKVQMSSPMPTPRIIVLHTGSLPVPFHRGNDEELHHLRHQLFMTIHIDAHDDQERGVDGAQVRTEMLGMAWEAIERSLPWLFEQGYEQVMVRKAELEIPAEEGVLLTHRGTLMVSAEIHPRPF